MAWKCGVAAWKGHARVVAELLKKDPDLAVATTQEHCGVPAGSTVHSVAQKHIAALRALNGDLDGLDVQRDGRV